MSKEVKICSGKNGCDKIKPLEEFSKEKRSAAGISNLCKKCKAKYQKEWKKKNPIKAAEHAKISYLGEFE